MRKLGLGLVVAALAGVAGCGDGNKNTDDMGVSDMGVGDMPSTRPDMTVPLMLDGKKVVSGAAQYITVNDDGWLLYFGSGINAVKLDGTSDTKIIPNGFGVLPGKKVVFGLEVADQMNPGPTAKLWAWKNGEASAREVTTAAVMFPNDPNDQRTLVAAAASDDGTKILFTKNATATTTDIALANYDGTSEVPVLTGIPRNGACELTMGFAGGKFFVGYCTAQPTMDGGIATSTVISVDATTGAQTPLFTGARNFFSVNTAGTKVFGISATQQPMWVASTGGTPTMITSDPVLGEVGLINPAGNNIVWVTTTKKLMRLDVSQPSQSPVEITSGLATELSGGGLLAISPDFAWGVVAKQFSSQAQATDVILTSLTTAGQVTPLVTTATGAIFGEGFTKDSTRVLYYTDVVDGAGTLHSKPVAGGADVVLASDVWLEYPGVNNKVLFTDRHHDGANGGLVDLKWIDASGGTATLVSTNIDDDPRAGVPELTRDGRNFIYTYSGRPSTAVGIYVFPVP
jgi:hypothetical protein